MIRICVAGATGWTGSAVTRAILKSSQFELTGAIARKSVGNDVGTVLGLPPCGVAICSGIDEALGRADVLIDYTNPESVRTRVFEALARGVHVVIGTSGLTAQDHVEIGREAERRHLGVISAGNFSITAALAKRCALMAAQYLPSWEIIDYANAEKPDAPSGTARELAEELACVRDNARAVEIGDTIGVKEARGANVAGTQVHSVRLPGYMLSFETLFGLPDERLSIRHDAGAGAEPYVYGTLLAAREVTKISGIIRGLDRLLFTDESVT